MATKPHILHRSLPLVLALVILLGISLVLSVMFMRGGSSVNENAGGWSKDSRGVWVARGEPSDVPSYVREQRFLINEALLALSVAKQNGTSIEQGPCLGRIFQGWVADIVHIPRTPADSLPENQCEALSTAEAEHSIELSASGEIVNIE